MQVPLKKISFFTFLFVLFSLFTILLAKEKLVLPQKHKKWIEEDVVYIATSKERDVFYKLETDKERDLFIELFWKQRDPSPGTPRNEFREEHYRRIDHANKEFKKYTSVEGWRTDRGRIYIILGEPIHIEKFHRSEAHPIEIWQYYGNPKFWQAPGFRLLFFRRHGIGPFELYNPIADGPKALTPLSSMRLPSSSGVRGSEWSHLVTDPRDLAAGVEVEKLQAVEEPMEPQLLDEIDVLDAAGGPERLAFLDVAQAHTPALAIAQLASELIGVV